MRIGLAVDAACDLPHEFLDEHRIAVLPITLKLGAHTVGDNRDAAVTRMFYREHYGQRGQDAETAPLSSEQLRPLFLHRLALDYDHVFALTIASTRSPMHANLRQAAPAIAAAARAVRDGAGIAGAFALHVVDTQNLFAAQGVLAVEGARMVRAGATAVQIAERLELLARRTYGYLVPRALPALRARAKGELSAGWLSAALDAALDMKPLLRAFQGDTSVAARPRGFDEGVKKLFDFLAQRVKAGLLAPTLCLSYGGELKELEALPGYGGLQRHCREHKVEVYASVMSMTGAVNVGEGALAVGFASEPHAFA